jgi:hypothetical protein
VLAFAAQKHQATYLTDITVTMLEAAMEIYIKINVGKTNHTCMSINTMQNKTITLVANKPFKM